MADPRGTFRQMYHDSGLPSNVSSLPRPSSLAASLRTIATTAKLLPMKRPLALALGLTALVFASWIGCSSSDDGTTFGPPPKTDGGNDVSSQGGAAGQAGQAGAAGTSSGGSATGGSAGAATGGSAGIGTGGSAGSPATGGSGGEPLDASLDVSYPDVDFSYDAPSFDGTTEACATANVEAALKPLDMYFMIDRSGSMAGNPWIQQGQALSAFFHAPGSAGITVAMRFFPITDDFSAKDPGCTGDSYIKPLVNWGVLPGWANALDTAYSNVIPNGGTPTQEAIIGVLKGALARQIAFPQHVVVAVMVSDGAPCCTTCPVESASGIGQIAAGYLNGAPSIRTFAIYVSAQANDVMTAIAVQGGTGQAFNATGGTQALLDALKTIQGTAIPCEFDMPVAEAGIINPDQITLDYMSGGNKTPVGRVDNQNLCDVNGGWYYDNNASPSKILLCPATCTTMKADPMAKVNISLGCLGS